MNHKEFIIFMSNLGVGTIPPVPSDPPAQMTILSVEEPT